MKVSCRRVVVPQVQSEVEEFLKQKFIAVCNFYLDLSNEPTVLCSVHISFHSVLDIPYALESIVHVDNYILMFLLTYT